MTSKQNFKDRTLWIRDNLEVMRGMNSETVDLIYLDPPFNSKRIYNAPLGSKAVGAKFTDTWTMDSMKEEWTELQEEADPAVFHTVMGAGLAAGDSMQAYMCFMAPRLQECYRILKPTGSLYLHCDPTASHYLKQLLDCIFGKNHFQNEVIWSYGLGGASKKKYSRKHDVLFFYTKSKKYVFDKPQVPATSNRLKGKMKGATDVWAIPTLNNMAKERTGWPTQKPLALLERIVKASSNEGDLVFDPFAGCATAMVAAERLGRRWAGCDIDEVATGITLKRLQDFADTDGEGTVADQVTFPKSAPKRTDSEAPKRSRNIKDILWKTLGGVINIGGNEMRVCPGCGRPHYRDAFHIDHIVPKSKGGPDVDSNLQLLCGSCNTKKGNRMTMKELQASNGFTEAKPVTKEAKPSMTTTPVGEPSSEDDNSTEAPVW